MQNTNSDLGKEGDVCSFPDYLFLVNQAMLNIRERKHPRENERGEEKKGKKKRKRGQRARKRFKRESGRQRRGEIYRNRKIKGKSKGK